MSKVNGYVSDVLGGDIATCKMVRAAVQRHVDDLARQSTPDFPYHFDANSAEIAIDFFGYGLRHSLGEWADRPFILEPWQAFGIANIHGWKRDDDQTRRFRTVYWSMARKNGKSAMIAGEAIQLAGFDFNPKIGKIEPYAEVILCATKKEQAAKIVYAEVLRMRGKSPSIRGMSTDINKQVTFSDTGGYIFPIGSDKEYDGLNSHGVIKDEVHAMRECHRDFYNSITTGSGNRTQPLNITITTAGDNHSLIWLEEYGHARGVVEGTIKDESTFVLCYEIDKEDDPYDEENWIKANPNIDVSVSRDYLREQAVKSKATRLRRNNFVRRHMNRLVSATEQAFDMDLWDKCRGELSDWSDADAVGAGGDLGGRDDLAGKACVARFLIKEIEDENGELRPLWRYEARAKGYISEDTTRDLEKEPFNEWIYTEKLCRCKYPLMEMRGDLREDFHEYRISDIAYDPAGAQYFAEELENDGLPVASMAQTYAQFTEPINELMAAIRDGRFLHDGDPVLRWCVSNAVAIRDRQDRWMFDKSKSSDKIDLAVALTMAFRRAMVAPRRSEGALFIT